MLNDIAPAARGPGAEMAPAKSAERVSLGVTLTGVATCTSHMLQVRPGPGPDGVNTFCFSKPDLILCLASGISFNACACPVSWYRCVWGADCEFIGVLRDQQETKHAKSFDTSSFACLRKCTSRLLLDLLCEPVSMLSDSVSRHPPDMASRRSSLFAALRDCSLPCLHCSAQQGYPSLIETPSYIPCSPSRKQGHTRFLPMTEEPQKAIRDTYYSA